MQGVLKLKIVVAVGLQCAILKEREKLSAILHSRSQKPPLSFINAFSIQKIRQVYAPTAL